MNAPSAMRYYAMELKPCPFCDELPVVRDDSAIVSCRNKECEVRPAVSRITHEMAIEAWNKRPSQRHDVDFDLGDEGREEE